VPHQIEITVQAPLREGSRASLDALLARIRTEGYGAGALLAFADLTAVHFARVFVLDEVVDPDGAVIPASLVLMCDADAPLRNRLAELGSLRGLDELLSHCRDYPAEPSPPVRLAWLREHRVRAVAYYVHRVGRSRQQVVAEQRLRSELEDMLDAPGALDGEKTPSGMHRRLREAVAARSDLSWACSPAARPSLWFRVREAVHLVAVPAALLVLAPVLVPVALVALVLIRLHERRDVAESGPVDLGHSQAVQRYEDFGAQNPFTAVGFVKPGLLRHATMRTVLLAIDYASRHLFNRDNLAGVRSIHFARWVSLDGGRRVVFASSYDGSQESYMDDFIDRLAWGLNAAFSNGVGYPKTRWLFRGGAKDEVTFKHYLRSHQVPTSVFWSAYDRVPAPQVDAASRLREELGRPLDDDQAARWLALL
jgi:hypothetical protein